MLGWIEWWWLGVFIAPTTILAIGWLLCPWAHWTVPWCTEHSTVHCPVRAKSTDHWVLERLTIEVVYPFDAPDSLVAHQTVRCDLSSQTVFWLLTLQTARIVAQLTVGWSWLLHVVSPFSPVAHQTVRWFLVDERWENPRAASSRSDTARAPNTVRCATGCSKSVCSKLVELSRGHFLCICIWTICTWEKYQLGKLVSPHGLCWTSNTQIDYRKCWGHFPFSLPFFGDWCQHKPKQI
jgi:hypothetical protein